MSTSVRLVLVALLLCSTLGIPLSLAKSTGPDVGISSPHEFSCQDYNDDRAYLLDVKVDIFAGPNGPTVRVTRTSDGKLLREILPGEKFYEGGGNLSIQYTIAPQCGGFDVVYTLSNPSATPQPHPELRVEGMRLETSGDIYMLGMKDWGNVKKLKLISDQGTPITVFSVGAYPTWVYSPVIVAHDPVVAAGSALHYPLLSPGYRHTVDPVLERVISGPQAGTWKHRYNHFTEEGGCYGITKNAAIPAGAQREYTVSVRFAESGKWLLTLFPYKEYFNSLYSSSADPPRKDRRPVMGISAAQLEATNPTPGDPDPWKTNPRSYLPFIGPDGRMHRLDIDGWGPFTDMSLSNMTALGYERIMIWAPSGLYGPGPPVNLNFPPQFMSDWLPMLVRTQGELSRFADNNMSLGMWWGRATSIPVPLQWNPETLVDAEYTDPQHIQFLSNEVKLAYERGTNEIGLDLFLCMRAHQRWLWVDDMKNLVPGTTLVHEGQGADLFHRKMANFIVPTLYNGEQVKAPDVLSAYLNPGSPIWLYFGYCPSQPEYEIWCTPEGVQTFVRWGFTPVTGWPRIDVKGLDYTLVACFDGLDNDSDGVTDWPYDSGCASAADPSEHSIVPPQLPDADNSQISAK